MQPLTVVSRMKLDGVSFSIKLAVAALNLEPETSEP